MVNINQCDTCGYEIIPNDKPKESFNGMETITPKSFDISVDKLVISFTLIFLLGTLFTI